MEVLSNKLDVPKWVCALAILLSTVALGVQATVDVYQNINPNMDRVAWLTQVWTMSLPTGYTLVFAAIGGCLLHAGRWRSAACLYALVGCYMGYTASNSMDFMSNQTVAVTQSQINKAVSAKDIAEIKNKLALDERRETLGGLWRSYLSAKPGSEKDKALAAYRDSTSEQVTLVQPDHEVVHIGVGGVANKYFGWRPEAIQEAKAFVFPILIMIGKALGITLGFACWPSRKAELWREKTPLRLPATNGSFQETTRKLSLSYDEAKADLRAMLAAGASVESQRVLADRWGVGPGQVSKWKPKFRRDGIPFEIVANGNRRAIVAAHHNGNGRVVGTA